MVRKVGIRGAGLSGLSLARELLTTEPTVSVTLFDVRPRLPHPQRTFCFFSGPEERYRSLASFEWRNVRFRGESFERCVPTPSSPYVMVRGDDFFEHIVDELEALGALFHWECPSVQIEDKTIVAKGERFTFDCVVDAAFASQSAQSMMWQSFAGTWVTTENAIFDPGVATLMELEPSSANVPVSFFYILPTSTHSALVEHTTFAVQRFSQQYHLARCEEWLQQRTHGWVRHGEQEYGAIPMGLRYPERVRALRVGTNAGAVRPSTGYAFQVAQDQVIRLSKRILAGVADDEDSGCCYPRWLERGDRMFLRVLLASAGKGAFFMEQLLMRAQPAALIAFLSGRVTFTQALSVWFSAPKFEMIRALLRV